jgi:hypothetical protein
VPFAVNVKIKVKKQRAKCPLRTGKIDVDLWKNPACYVLYLNFD